MPNESIDTEKLISLLKLRNYFIIDPTSTSTVGMTEENKLNLNEYNQFRLNILNILIEKYLLNNIKLYIINDLLKLSNNIIINESINKFNSLLSIGPFRPVKSQEEDIKELLLNCPNSLYKGTIMSIYLNDGERSPIYLSYIDINGCLKGYNIIPIRIIQQKFDIIKQFIIEYKPNIIVCNSSGGMTSKTIINTIDKELIKSIQLEIMNNYNNNNNNKLKNKNIMINNNYDDSDSDEEMEEYSPSVSYFCTFGLYCNVLYCIVLYCIVLCCIFM